MRRHPVLGLSFFLTIVLPAFAGADIPALLQAWTDDPLLRGTSVTCVAPLEDRVYVGTLDRGVIEIRGEAPPTRFFGTSAWGPVHGAAVQDGNAWFATGKGLHCIGDPPAAMKPYLGREEEVLDVAAHPDRLVWITRTTIGMATDLEVTFEKPDEVWMRAAPGVRIATSADHLAYGGDGNLVTWDGLSWNHYFLRLKDKRITALAMEPDGTVWAGTRNGLVHIPHQRGGVGGAAPITWYLQEDGHWGDRPGHDETHVTAVAVLGTATIAVGLTGRTPMLYAGAPPALKPDATLEVALKIGSDLQVLEARENQLWGAGPWGLAVIEARTIAPIPRDPFVPVERGATRPVEPTGAPGISIHVVKIGDVLPGVPDSPPVLEVRTPPAKKGAGGRFEEAAPRVAPSRRIGGSAETSEQAPYRTAGPVSQNGAGGRFVADPRSPPPVPAPTPWNGPATAALIALTCAAAALIRWIAFRIDEDLTARVMRADLLADAIEQRLQAIPAARQYFGESLEDVQRLASETERQARLVQELRRLGRDEEARPMMARIDHLVTFLEDIHLALVRLSANGQHTPEGGWSSLTDRLAELSREILDIERNLASTK